MQKLLIIIFATAFFLKPGLPVVEYILNYDYIVEELCINKDKENLGCNGKCHLKNALADASGASEKNLPDRKLKPSQIEILFCNDIPTLILSLSNVSAKAAPDTYCVLYAYADGTTFFHPPAQL